MIEPINEYSVVKGHYQSALNMNYDCIPNAYRNMGLYNINMIELLTVMPATASSVPFNKQKHDIVSVYPIISKAQQGEYATACLSISWLQEIENNERTIGIISGISLNEDAAYIVDKALDISIKLYNEHFSNLYELKDIDTFTESVFAGQAHACSIVAIAF